MWTARTDVPKFDWSLDLENSRQLHWFHYYSDKMYVNVVVIVRHKVKVTISVQLSSLFCSKFFLFFLSPRSSGLNKLAQSSSLNIADQAHSLVKPQFNVKKTSWLCSFMPCTCLCVAHIEDLARLVLPPSVTEAGLVQCHDMYNAPIVRLWHASSVNIYFLNPAYPCVQLSLYLQPNNF